MEHSRIILGEKVYKELNPTSKEIQHPPTLWLGTRVPLYLLDCSLLATPQLTGSSATHTLLCFFYPTLLFLHLLSPFLHPLLRIGLVE